jgi:hypothetical protein
LIELVLPDDSSSENLKRCNLQRICSGRLIFFRVVCSFERFSHLFLIEVVDGMVEMEERESE